MSYKVVFDSIRSETREGVRYAKVRAIANGEDSYRSVFTVNARESLIDQIKSNGVKTNALHRNTIISNIDKFLRAKLETAMPNEKDDIETLLGSLPAMDFPIGTVEDAYFVDDNVVEAVIRENVDLKEMGGENAQYLNSAWNMVMDGTLGGVSLVFNNLKTSQVGNKMFIDDLRVQGLDFVDRPSHKDTRVVDTFMRAMQDITQEDTKMTNEETKPVEQAEVPKEQPKVVEVDEIVTKVTEQLTKKQEEDKRKEQLSAQELELEELRKFKAEAENKTQALEADKQEAVKIAEEAIKSAEEATAKIDNPFAQRAKEEAEAANDPLEGKSLRELVKAKLQVK